MIVIVLIPVAPTWSVAVMVSTHVPTAVFDSTVTIPVIESIVMPVRVGLIPKVLLPVPVEVSEVKAGVIWRIPKVVVIFPPPLTTTTGLTTSLITVTSVKLSRSLTVMVS